MKTYVGLYIFASAAKDDVLDRQVEKACGEITRLSGKVLETEVLGKKVFARPMGKRDSGVYVRVRFEADPAQIAALTNRYHLMEEVFRVQITAVDPRREAKIARQTEARLEREAKREAARAAAEEKARLEAEAAAAAAQEAPAEETGFAPEETETGFAPAEETGFAPAEEPGFAPAEETGFAPEAGEQAPGGEQAPAPEPETEAAPPADI